MQGDLSDTIHCLHNRCDSYRYRCLLHKATKKVIILLSHP
uniref:Uncharacterized protein n=1 Tax=Siphoviridae sp. ct4T77 TaxID=2823563 RepID=A0A8S5L934_9CAUD|nr:MAG TPA: hypothetical protein [Siphoviridae sp. ct4T77]